MIEASFRGRIGAFDLDVQFAAPASGATVLFGPSGCGKTSLLRCIAGLERLEGRLVIDGEVWQDDRRFLPPHQRPVGYVFQEASLLAHLSVRQNLLFGFARVAGPKPITLDKVIDLLGLEPLLERGVTRLSGGERQRIGVGRALLSQPRLLLLDEPLANLDAARKEEVLPYLERLHQDLAVPMLYVTHDRAEARRLGDRLLPMEAGRVGALTDMARGDDLSQRLEAVGPDALLRELIAEGASETAARLTIAALKAGLPGWR